jgi:F-type H+-transporting ATPase subunit delta
MNQSRVASRYAKSLLDLSLEQGVLEQVKADMLLVHETCKESRDLVVLLGNPVIKTDKKEAILNAIFGGKISTLTFKFIEIITAKKREEYIPSIALEFLNQYKKHKQVLTAVITTSIGLDDHLRNKVLELVKKESAAEVELVEKLDKGIIGGFILSVGDKRIDSSLAGKIARLKRSFSENPYVKEF